MESETTRQQEKCQGVSLLQCNTTPGDLVLGQLCVWCEKDLATKKEQSERERDRQISPSEQTPLILLLLNPSVDLLIFEWPTCDFRHEA